MKPKIFGIGLSRTGTKSLSRALTYLGYRTAHFTDHLCEERGFRTWFCGSFEKDCLEVFDAATDNPIPLFYRELDLRYPNSRFILTTRDISGWLRSVQMKFQQDQRLETATHPYRLKIRQRVFGAAEFDENKYSEAYRQHEADVRRYFQNRPNDFLEMDVTLGDGWEKLCPFLGHEILGSTFPWENLLNTPKECQ